MVQMNCFDVDAGRQPIAGNCFGDCPLVIWLPDFELVELGVIYAFTTYIQNFPSYGNDDGQPQRPAGRYRPVPGS